MSILKFRGTRLLVVFAELCVDDTQDLHQEITHTPTLEKLRRRKRVVQIVLSASIRIIPRMEVQTRKVHEDGAVWEALADVQPVKEITSR